MMWKFGLVAIALLIGMSTGQGAGKKGKEIPTQICKRGKLIFEDDFSEKELKWTFDESECSWKLQKGALVTSSVQRARVLRNMDPVTNFVLEARFVLPPKSALYITWSGMQVLQFFPCLNSSLRQAALRQYRTGGNMDIKVTPFPYKERAATTLLFEVLNGQFALSVDRKCVELKSEVETINESGYIRLELQLAEPGLFAVDYVKVWEALPKNNDEK